MPVPEDNNILKNNSYDYFLIILICLLAFGMYGDSLQPVRIVSIASLPLLIIHYFTSKDIKPLQNSYKIATGLFCWIAYSLLWSSDFLQGSKEVFYYLSHLLLLLLVLVFFSKANNSFKSLVKGWFLFILITLPIAFVEIIYNQHLSVNLIDSALQIHIGEQGIQKRFASATFGNYNTYVMVITMALPFIFGYLYTFKKKFSQLLAIFVIISSYFILLINASRGGIIAGVIILLIWLIHIYREKINYLKIKLGLLIPLTVIALVNYINILFGEVSNRIASGASFIEGESRTILFESAFNAFWRHPIFGSGVGSIQSEMEDVSITLPHNLFLEFLVQFGLIATIIIGILFFFMLKHISSLPSLSKTILYSIYISLPIIFVINSSYLLHPVLWVFIASIYCISYKKKLTQYDA